MLRLTTTVFITRTLLLHQSGTSLSVCPVGALTF